MATKLDESHTIKSGAYSVTVKADPLVFDFDKETIAEPVARAIRDAIAHGIETISATSRDGKHRLFNKTGELVRGLTVVPLDGEAYAIIPPAGRLNDPAMVERLAGLVPAIDDPHQDSRVAQAVERSAERMVRSDR